jgi:hypothetical protein
VTDAVTGYFETLARYSERLLDRLPIQRQPQSISDVMGVLQPALEAARGEGVRELETLERPPPPRRDPAPVGMNTIGILADRLTILCVKAWNLQNKQHDPVAAEALRRTHVKQIVDCMAFCAPGEADLLKKVTGLTSDVDTSSWEQAYYGLLASNILLWEAQEVLYLKDINTAPCEELRDYIKWFSYGNIDRNKCISACEVRYWAPILAASGKAR